MSEKKALDRALDVMCGMREDVKAQAGTRYATIIRPFMEIVRAIADTLECEPLVAPALIMSSASKAGHPVSDSTKQFLTAAAVELVLVNAGGQPPAAPGYPSGVSHLTGAPPSPNPDPRAVAGSRRALTQEQTTDINICRTHQQACKAYLSDPTDTTNELTKTYGKQDRAGAILGLEDWFLEEMLITYPEYFDK